jgi:hypothetical protein
MPLKQRGRARLEAGAAKAFGSLDTRENKEWIHEVFFRDSLTSPCHQRLVRAMGFEIARADLELLRRTGGVVSRDSSGGTFSLGPAGPSVVSFVSLK